MQHHEDTEAMALWSWAQHDRILRDHLAHIPNGGRRNKREAARMKRMGVRAGVHDYFLPVPRGRYHGLWIELKATPPNNARVTKEQREWMERMRDQGYAAYVCKGWVEAARVIRWYVDKLPAPEWHDMPGHMALSLILNSMSAKEAGIT